MDSSAVPSEPIYTAHDIKRLLLVSLENEGVGSAKSVPSTMLTHLSMYDTSTTMPFPTALSFGEGEDLACIVEKAAKGFAAHDKLRQDLGYYIGNAENPLTEDMKRSVKELLDQDLVDRGLVVKNPKILKAPLLLKARVIANDMERKKLGVDAVDDGHDFIVQLLTLVHGWGQVSKVDMLRFKSKTSFWHFISTLKTETRDSIIPPENVIFPPILLSESPMDNGIPDPISDVPAPIRDPNDRGYSLSDGPWMYKLPHVGKDDAQKPGWKCIKDENEYMIMLDGIKAVNSKYVEWKQPSKCSVAIMHSLDRECQQRYFDNREEERAYSIKWEKELEEAGFFDDDEELSGNPGDDWFDYWKRINSPKSLPKNT